MRGSAEAVESNRVSTLARHAVAAPANETGTEQRRDLAIIHVVRQSKAVPCVRQHVARIAAIACVAGEQRVIAQVLPACAAIRTYAAGEAKPWNTHALAECKSADAGSQCRYTSHNLMARDDGQLGVGQLAINDMKVRAAHAAGRNLHQDFTFCR
jgi:hypothetical protein